MDIKVDGIEHVVLVSDDGVFIVVIDGQRYESDTLRGLREKVLSGKWYVKAAIPFTIIEGGLVRHGVATNVREIDNSVMVIWDKGHQRGTVKWEHHTLKRLGNAEAEEYRQLCADRDYAARAVEDFERTRRINLKDAIAAALAADEKEGRKR